MGRTQLAVTSIKRDFLTLVVMISVMHGKNLSLIFRGAVAAPLPATSPNAYAPVDAVELNSRALTYTRVLSADRTLSD
ncbi:hypothetical protein I6F15_28025 [Bradyrhizobium sp. BRP14]|nr:hypothetical protein [Bradyrhizobium sp. BRP14]